MKEIVHVPGISDALVKYNVPISAAVKANGFVFISGAPPIDPETGKLVTGNIEEQTEAVLRYLGKGPGGLGIVIREGREGHSVCRELGVLRAHQRNLSPLLSPSAPGPDIRHGRLVADGVRHRDRMCRACGLARRWSLQSDDVFRNRSPTSAKSLIPSGA